ncbi:importin subunit alpha-1-like [Eriocheir sinensis]|uniref:importin subunit alpha-1-like n=1 Tax=Eriocheir sinensis TaxID=95602 RepID=UPI0021C8A60E|nr:importin subunit alpha-1-like [Eriocheir sinensis]
MSLSAKSSSMRRGGGTLSMDMESIRARRAKLESILHSRRPPPLTGDPAKRSPASGAPLPLSNPTRRSSYSSSSSTSIDSSYRPVINKSGKLSPYTQHLPQIEKNSTSLLQTSAPEYARQTRRRNHCRGVMEEELVDLEDGGCSQEALEELVRGIGSNSRKRRLYSTVQARKLLSAPHPPLREFLRAGILKPLIPHVQQREDSTLQQEATCVLTNLASGNYSHTAAVVDAGAVPVLVAALADGDEKVKEQAAMALGNIAGEERYRNLLVSAGVVTPLLRALRSGRDSAASTSSATSSGSYISAPVSLVRAVTWVLANIFRHKGLVMAVEEQRACAASLRTLLAHADPEVNVDALWLAGYIAAGDEAGQREVVAAGAVPELVRHLGSRERQRVIPALRATGNLALGDDSMTDAVVAAGALPLYGRLLRSRHHNLRKEAAWALSNVTAGDRRHVQRVIDEGLLTHLVEVLGQNHLDVQREATWALGNLASGGDAEQLGALVAAGGAAALTAVLVVSEKGTVEAALKALQCILKTPELRKEALRQVRAAEGVRRLEALQGFVDSGIRERATDILEVYLREGDTAGAEDDADVDADDEAESEGDDS